MKAAALPTIFAGCVAASLACSGGSSPSDPGGEETGGLRVLTTTVGEDPDADGYRVSVAGTAMPIGSEGSVLFPDLSPRSYVVELSRVAPNCSASAASRSVDVTAGEINETSFQVSCVAAGEVVFTRSTPDGGSWDLFLIRTDGTGETRLTHDGAREFHAAWSPDGTRIAYSTNRDGNREIYVMEADGSNATRLTDHPPPEGEPSSMGEDKDPAWSPDGTRIAYSSVQDGNHDILVMNADGTGGINLTANPGSRDEEPTWSPDGARIAFRRGGPDGSGIYVMNGDGTGIQRLSDHESDFGPAWSPDGRRIAFTSLRDGQWEIYVVDADGSSVSPLTQRLNARSPAWSPDGSRLAFTALVTGGTRIFLMAFEGGRVVQLTRTSGIDDLAAWRPEG